MIKAIVFDLSYTLFFPKDKNYKDELNRLYKDVKNNAGFNFSDYFYLDEEVFSFVSSLTENNNLYMFTSGVIQNAPEIKERLSDVFIKIYSAEEMGVHKSDPNAYLRIAKETGFLPGEILFVDDSEKNINAAKDAGLETILFDGLDNLQVKIKNYIS